MRNQQGNKPAAGETAAVQETPEQIAARKAAEEARLRIAKSIEAIATREAQAQEEKLRPAFNQLLPISRSWLEECKKQRADELARQQQQQDGNAIPGDNRYPYVYPPGVR